MSAAPKLTSSDFIRASQANLSTKPTPIDGIKALSPSVPYSGALTASIGAVGFYSQMMAGNLYETSIAMGTLRADEDYHAWLVEQAEALHSRQYYRVDFDALAEELEEMGRRERDALVSDLEVSLRHMLKLAYESRPIQRRWRERQWKLDTVGHRNRVKDLLERSGSLAKDFEEFKAKAYARARRAAGIAIDPDQQPVGPLDCPWSKEQILDDDFFPSAPTK